MEVEAPDSVFASADLSASAKLTLVFLYQKCRSKGDNHMFVWWPISKLAKALGRPRKSIQRDLLALEDLGMIRRETRTIHNRSTDGFEVLGPQRCVTTTHPPASQGRTPLRHHDAPPASQGRTPCVTTTHNHTILKLKLNHEVNQPAPRKPGKPAAPRATTPTELEKEMLRRFNGARKCVAEVMVKAGIEVRHQEIKPNKTNLRTLRKALDKMGEESIIASWKNAWHQFQRIPIENKEQMKKEWAWWNLVSKCYETSISVGASKQETIESYG